MIRLLCFCLAGVLCAAAGVAAASNFASSHQVDFFTEGKHQFYVWCPGGSDYTATSAGASAEDAQAVLYKSLKKAGKTTCWPIWQGHVAER